MGVVKAIVTVVRKISLKKKNTHQLVKDQGDTAYVFWFFEKEFLLDGNREMKQQVSKVFKGQSWQEEPWIVGEQTWMLNHDSSLVLAFTFLVKH